MKTTTYKCICGHIAYYLKRKGWRCTCNNPQKKGINMNDTISITWHIDDVRMAFDNPITDDQCREVLARVDKWHDCNIGVNWDVLNSYAEQVTEENE